jgi:hypothetical protein
MTDCPVVLVNGARQTGKSTLARAVAEQRDSSRYVTLDDVTAFSSASSDPMGFLTMTDGPVVLDEVQRVPALFRAIKLLVDRNRQPGRFLLTGSANVLLLPNVSESLAGRMEIHTLWPFSAGEREGRKETFLDALFGSEPMPSVAQTISRQDLFARIQTGGYPEVCVRPDPLRRAAWFEAYITTILQRDVRDLANIEHLVDLPRLLALLASRACGLLNYADLARSLGMPQSTLKRYMVLLETLYLIQTLAPWSNNLGKRVVKAPKLLFVDTGLAAHLLGWTEISHETMHPMAGPLLENFVAMELRKQASWRNAPVRLYHYRTPAGQEVDLVLEDRAGRIAGIEVKSSATVGTSDFKHLRALANTVGDRFVRGIVLYTGEETIPFAADLAAVPVNALWQG